METEGAVSASGKGKEEEPLFVFQTIRCASPLGNHSQHAVAGVLLRRNVAVPFERPSIKLPMQGAGTMVRSGAIAASVASPVRQMRPPYALRNASYPRFAS